jgi:hypothetical protein
MSVKFGWKYYMAPTPKNVKRLMIAIRGVLYAFMGQAIVTESLNHGYQLGLLALMYLLEEGSKFLTPDEVPPAPPAS